jgi:glycerol kinase
MAKCVLAIDQGTSSTRTILFNREGCILGQSHKEHQQYYPKPGWVEHDSLEIWANTLQLIQNVMAKTAVSKGDLAALGITNQRETTLIWERVSGKPIHNALVWQDTRTDTLIAEPIFPAPKSPGCLATYRMRVKKPKRATCFLVISIPG